MISSISLLHLGDKMKRIRVLEIINGFAVEGPLGGVERFGIELAQALDPARIDPVVCGLWQWGTPYEARWIAQLRSQEIVAFAATPKRDDSPYRNFLAALRQTSAQIEQPVDIIHSHSEFGDVAALLLRRRLGARAVVRTVHNEREWPKRPHAPPAADPSGLSAGL